MFFNREILSLAWFSSVILNIEGTILGTKPTTDCKHNMNLAESKKEANNLTTVHFVAPFIDTFFPARICELEPIWCWKF